MRSKKCFFSLCILLQVLLLSSCGGKRTDSVPVSYELPVDAVEYPVYNIPQLDASLCSHKVEIVFSDGTAETSVLPSGISAEINGADIVLRSQIRGVEYIVCGSSSDASLTIVSSYSPLVTLDSLSLTSIGKNALQVSSEEVVYLRTLGDCRITDLPDDVKADNQSAAVKLMGQAVLCGGNLAVNAGRRNALFCTETLYLDGMQLLLQGAPNNALLTNGSFVVASGNVSANSSKDVIKCKKGDFVVLGGNISLSSSDDKADGVQAENFFQRGGDLDVVVTGAASDGIKSAGNLCLNGGNLNVVTRGDALFNSKKSDYSSASCIKSDRMVEISGGNCSFRSEGNGAKGISCDSIIVVKDGNVSVVTKGGDVNDLVDINAHTSSKGIKSDGSIYLAGGNIEVLVFGEGERSEGVEAKKDLHVSGDCNLYVYAYDDAINAGNLLVAGGKVYAYSVANDAIDSNGEICVDGGLVIADGSFSPEQGVDVDNYSLFSVRGGVLFSVGGSMGPSPAMPLSDRTSVPAFAWSGFNLDKGRFLSLVDDEERVLYSYKVQRSMPNAACVVASSLLHEDGIYSFVISDSLESGELVCNGVYKGGHPNVEVSSVRFEPEGLVNVVDRNGNVTLLEPGKNIGGMPPPPPNGMFPGDSAVMGGHGFPPPPPHGMFPGDSAVMGAHGFPPPPPHGMFPGDSAVMGGHGFPPPPPHGMLPGDSAAMGGHGFPPPPHHGMFPGDSAAMDGHGFPPPPMRRIKSEFGEGNLPNLDK